MALVNSLRITFIITSYKLKNNFEMTFWAVHILISGCTVGDCLNAI